MRTKARAHRLIRIRGFQFTVRALLLLVTIACSVAGLVAHWFHARELEAAALQYYLERGGVANYEPFAPRWLANLMGRDSFYTVRRLCVGSGCYRRLGTARFARYMERRRNDLSDSDLIIISRLRHLESLSISSMHVTDAGLGYIARLQGLRDVTLRAPLVTEHGVRLLARTKHIESIHLINARMSRNKKVRVAADFPSVRFEWSNAETQRSVSADGEARAEVARLLNEELGTKCLDGKMPHGPTKAGIRKAKPE